MSQAISAWHGQQPAEHDGVLQSPTPAAAEAVVAGRAADPAEPAFDGDIGASAGHDTLRQLRLRRFWTQAEFAAAFEARSRQIGRPLSLSVRQVRRWESDSPPLPLPAYQAVLEALYGLSIESMGFQPGWARRAAEPAGARPAQLSRVVGGAENARSPMDDPGGQDPVKRRQLVAGALAVGCAAAVGDLMADANRAAGPATATTHTVPAAPGSPGRYGDMATLDGYTAIAAHHRALYWSVPAAAMFSPVAAHTELGLGLMRRAGSPALRTRLAAPVALTALLGARLAFFDLKQPHLAEGYFAVSLDAAREAANRSLVAVVLAHMAFAPAFTGRGRRARDLMAQAHRQARGAAGPLQTSWLYAVEAEVEAKTGGGRAARDLIAKAEMELARVPQDTAAGSAHRANSGSDPDWLDFFDASRLAGFKGYCALSGGRPADAVAALETTLRELPAEGSKQRSVVLADLAAARLAQGERDEAARLLGGAIGQLRAQWYATGVDRVDSVRRRLAASGAPLRTLAPVDEARRALELSRPA